MIYEYKCEDCGFVNEITRKVSEKPDFLFCPECVGTAHPHISSAPLFSLKGKGWAGKEIKKRNK